MNIRIRKVKVPKRIRIKIIQKLLLVAFFFCFSRKHQRVIVNKNQKNYIYILIFHVFKDPFISYKVINN